MLAQRRVLRQAAEPQHGIDKIRWKYQGLLITQQQTGAAQSLDEPDHRRHVVGRPPQRHHLGLVLRQRGAHRYRHRIAEHRDDMWIVEQCHVIGIEPRAEHRQLESPGAVSRVPLGNQRDKARPVARFQKPPERFILVHDVVDCGAHEDADRAQQRGHQAGA